MTGSNENSNAWEFIKKMFKLEYHTLLNEGPKCIAGNLLGVIIKETWNKCVHKMQHDLLFQQYSLLKRAGSGQI